MSTRCFNTCAVGKEGFISSFVTVQISESFRASDLQIGAAPSDPPGGGVQLSGSQGDPVPELQAEVRPARGRFDGRTRDGTLKQKAPNP